MQLVPCPAKVGKVEHRGGGGGDLGKNEEDEALRGSARECAGTYEREPRECKQVTGRVGRCAGA